MMSKWEIPRDFREVEIDKIELIRHQIKKEMIMNDRESYLEGAREAICHALYQAKCDGNSEAKFQRFKSGLMGWYFEESRGTLLPSVKSSELTDQSSYANDGTEL